MMVRTQWVVGWMAMGVLAIAMAGCGGSSGPDLDAVAVTGTVTLDGKPVDGATVTFVPQSGGTAAVGQTDASGRYSLTSLGTVQGAVPGEYSVTVTKYSYAGGAAASGSGGEEMPDDYQNPGAAGGDDSGKNQLPPKYENPAQSELKATVTSDAAANVFDFQLESGQ